MDNLVTIIILIFIVTSFLRRKAAALKKPDPKKKKKKPGLLDSLSNLKTMLEEAAETHQAKTEPAGDAGRKGRTIPAAEFFRKKPVDSLEGLEAFAGDLDALPDFVEEVVPPPAPPVRKRPPARKARKAKAPPPRPERPEEEKTSLPDTGFGLNELQKAIVWSEILGPPIALRKDRSQ